MNDKEIIKQMYIDYWNYMIHKDAKGLYSLFDKNYTLKHMTGLVQNADTFINQLQQGTFHYYSAKHEKILIDIKEDTATLIGQSIVDASVYGSARHTWSLQGNFTLIKTNDDWKFTSSSVSTY